MAARESLRTDEIGEELAAWGKVAILETRGRSTGRRSRAAVGFLEEEDGSLLVAAGSGEADWALNLEADPRCRVEIGERRLWVDALRLDGEDRNAAIAGLILRYGTPAERLGAGPAFRLVPVPPADEQ